MCALPYHERGKKQMLKISLIDSARQRRVIVEGRLIAPWAAELKSTCEKARAHLHGRELVLVLKDLTAISHEGENVILELIREGVRFSCRGVFTKLVFRELTRRARRKAMLISSRCRIGFTRYRSNRNSNYRPRGPITFQSIQ